ncbi:hypothetical protein [Brevibacillus centrosporus]|uniref:hypothetical protein n=2 Tax=Brevibacillus TaxID=55080 RepID=UPI002E1E8027|nr:hypothetical protein [Brevibacillus centrosporus]
MNLLLLWQDDTLHAQLELIMFKHITLVKEFSTASIERKQEIIGEIEKLRHQRQSLLAE